TNPLPTPSPLPYTTLFRSARMRAFSQWLGLLRPMCDAIAELLWLTRQNGRNRQETAKGGTLNITFDRDNPLQLLRISLPASAGRSEEHTSELQSLRHLVCR